MRSLHHTCAAAGLGGTRHKFIKSTTALSIVLIAIGLPAQVLAQTATPPTDVAQAGSEASTLEAVTVTGSRIITNGYDAPTPLSVINAGQLENRSQPDLPDLVAQMPSIAGSGLAQTNTNGLSGSTSGLNLLNLRALGYQRTLILLDGERTVGSTSSGQGVDISSYPQQLISRVDIVTGGASAVYGSDAVAGVVNFVLDKDFTGFKAEFSGGETNYGDERNFTLDLTDGFGFADNRGHVLLSLEQEHNDGTDGDGGRAWDRTGTQIVANPAYKPGNGQPLDLVENDVGTSNETLGGIVASGPLKGLMFGPGGTPEQFQYGSLTTATQTVGGDWAITDTREGEALMQMETRTNLFERTSYDLTDNINAYFEGFWTRESESGPANLPYASSAATEPVIQLDNAFLPASVRAAMIADGLSQITVGTWNGDFGYEQVDNIRTTVQSIFGLQGKFDAFGTNWNWHAHASYGVALNDINYPNTYNLQNYANAINAVVNPATGAIVCQITLTNGTPCSPWDPLGTGVNNGNAAGKAYLIGGTPSHANEENEQVVYEGTVTGAPFKDWAGPVSMALDLVHRIESVHNNPDAVSLAIEHDQGNPGYLDGLLYVDEAGLETVVPLAKNLPFAQSWDFNGAVRATDYSQAGYVTTWKLGTTYAPAQDIEFRLTRSLDIRAPNVLDLFSPKVFSTGTVVDPFTGSTPTYEGLTRGNPNLVPERAYETGLGMVLTPRFIPGFAASVDWWQVDVKGAIGTTSATALVDACYTGLQPQFCADITRTNGQITVINLEESNIGAQDMTGMDVEASYHIRLGSGDLALHNNTTIYLNNYQSNGVGGITDYVDQNDGSLGPPRWRMLTSLTYQLDRFTYGLTSRMVSSGVLNNQDVQCTANCPVSTATNPTINDNHLPGAAYFDTNFQYNFGIHSGQATAYFTVQNILNRQPPPIASVANYEPLALGAAGIYDINGVVFRAGMRVKF